MLAGTVRADRLLLGAYLPIYLLALALHVHESARSGLAQLPVFGQPVAGGYPVVAGQRDLLGTGYGSVQAIGLARTTPALLSPRP